MSDLVKRLRSWPNDDIGYDAEDAADRIEALEAALREIIADCEADYPPSHGAIKYAARKALDIA